MAPTEIDSYVQACAEGPGARRQAVLLDRIIGAPALHARFVNTLSRLEYVGVRKMLKSRRAEALDLEGLQHMLDETVHALRLKKAATHLAATVAPGVAVETYGAADTLAGDAGEAYLQALDAAAEEAVADVPEVRRGPANYLLTSAAIEVRAQVFYPVYEQRLRAHGAGFSVAAIVRDEDRHLAEMTAGLTAIVGPEGWRRRLEPLLALEERVYGEFLDAVEAVMRSPSPVPSPRRAGRGTL